MTEKTEKPMPAAEPTFYYDGTGPYPYSPPYGTVPGDGPLHQG